MAEKRKASLKKPDVEGHAASKPVQKKPDVEAHANLKSPVLKSPVQK